MAGDLGVSLLQATRCFRVSVLVAVVLGEHLECQGGRISLNCVCFCCYLGPGSPKTSGVVVMRNGFREYSSDVLKWVIQIHERIFQLGWNDYLL